MTCQSPDCNLVLAHFPTTPSPNLSVGIPGVMSQYQTPPHLSVLSNKGLVLALVHQHMLVNWWGLCSIVSSLRTQVTTILLVAGCCHMSLAKATHRATSKFKEWAGHSYHRSGTRRTPTFVNSPDAATCPHSSCLELCPLSQ